MVDTEIYLQKVIQYKGDIFHGEETHTIENEDDQIVDMVSNPSSFAHVDEETYRCGHKNGSGIGYPHGTHAVGLVRYKRQLLSPLRCSFKDRQSGGNSKRNF